jgi:hypothetical protein
LVANENQAYSLGNNVIGGTVSMNTKLLVCCMGCSLILSGISMADEPEPEETPAILSALGMQAGVAVVSEAELAEVEGTAWLPRWRRAFRARIRSFFRASRAARRRVWAARLAWLRAQNGGGGSVVPETPETPETPEVPEGGGGVIEPPEMAE